MYQRLGVGGLGESQDWRVKGLTGPAEEFWLSFKSAGESWKVVRQSGMVRFT